MEADKHDVIKGRIADGSHVSYYGYISQLIHFHFDHTRQLPVIIKHDLMRKLIIANEEDCYHGTSQASPTNDLQS